MIGYLMQPTLETDWKIADGQQATRQSGSSGAINWHPIKLALVSGQMNVAEASATFNVKAATIYKRMEREAWPVPKRITKAVQKVVENTAVGEAVANIARERIERHIARTFDIASRSVAKFTVKAPKNFRELNIADQIARRAAAIQDNAPQTAVMLLLNEAVNSFNPDQPIEAEIVSVNPPAITNAA
jgi:hypothetical protein